jgi:hypothetical protein
MGQGKGSKQKTEAVTQVGDRLGGAERSVRSAHQVREQTADQVIEIT